jgi:hypothetical protein
MLLVHVRARDTRILPFYISKMAYLSSDLSSDSSPERTNQSAEPSRHKARSLEDILHEFGPITEVSYMPFRAEQPRPAKALLPSTFPA